MGQSVSFTEKPVQVTILLAPNKGIPSLLMGAHRKDYQRKYRREVKQALYFLSTLPDETLPAPRGDIAELAGRYFFSVDELKSALADWPRFAPMIEIE